MSASCPTCSELVEDSHTFCPHCAEPLGPLPPPVRQLPGRASSPSPADAPRSLGVTVIASANIVLGVLGIVAFVGFVVVAVVMFASSDRYAGLVGMLALAVAVACLVLLAHGLPVGLGLRSRRPWARVVGLVASVLWTLLDGVGLLVGVTDGAAFRSGESVAGLLVLALVLVFFVTQGVVLIRAGEEFAAPATPAPS